MPLVVLAGLPGAGKTACLRAIAKSVRTIAVPCPSLEALRCALPHWGDCSVVLDEVPECRVEGILSLSREYPTLYFVLAVEMPITDPYAEAHEENLPSC